MCVYVCVAVVRGCLVGDCPACGGRFSGPAVRRREHLKRTSRRGEWAGESQAMPSAFLRFEKGENERDAMAGLKRVFCSLVSHAALVYVVDVARVQV